MLNQHQGKHLLIRRKKYSAVLYQTSIAVFGELITIDLIFSMRPNYGGPGYGGPPYGGGYGGHMPSPMRNRGGFGGRR